MEQNRIKQLRQKNNLTQDDLAARLSLSHQAISNYERGSRVLDAIIINKLCDLFDVSADYLLCRPERPPEGITDEEHIIIMAYRAADPHTRAMVDLALKPYADSLGKGEAVG